MKNLGFYYSILRGLSKCVAYMFLVSANNVAFAIIVQKTFNPIIIAVGTESTLTITIQNNDASDASLLHVYDMLPSANLNYITDTFEATNCGTVSSSINTQKLSITDGVISATDPDTICTITIQVIASAVGNYTNTINAGDPMIPDGIFYTVNGQIITSTAISADLTVLAIETPGVEKSYDPNPIIMGQSSVLSIEFTNNNNLLATELKFQDTLLTGLTIADFNGTGNGIVENSCGGDLLAVADTQIIDLVNGTIQPNDSCIIKILVVPLTTGDFLNEILAKEVSYFVQGVNVPNIVGTSATLTVNNAPPAVEKSFDPDTISPGETSEMIITITNLNDASVNVDLHDNFEDTEIFIADAGSGSGIISNDCGNLEAVAGEQEIFLDFGLIAEQSSCTMRILVTSSVIGSHENTIPAGDVIFYIEQEEIPSTDEISATLTVGSLISPVVGKSFDPTSISFGQTSELSLTFTNNNITEASNLSAVDNLVPANLFIANNNNSGNGIISNTCGGTLTATAGSQSITLMGGSIAGNSSCSIVILVTATTDGPHVNNISGNAVSFEVQGTTLNGNAISATLTSIARPTISKRFSPDYVDDCGCSTLVITLSNPASTPATLIAPFVDKLPRDLEVVRFGYTTCLGGSVDVHNSRITLQSGAVIPANGSCTISVEVESKCNGEFTNRIAPGALQTSNGSNLLGVDATVNFCCEEEDSNAIEIRGQCLLENSIDEEEHMSL